MPCGEDSVRVAEPVRLVIDYCETSRIASVDAHHKVHAAREVAAEALAQHVVVKPVGVISHRVGCREAVAEDIADQRQRDPAPWTVAANERELELELVEAVRSVDRAQTD